MAKAVSKLLDELIDEFNTNRPDIILILGDRGEPFAAAIAGTYLNIPIAHIHGGEVSGSVDESVRHAISKLSHIHFPATQLSAERLIKMGEAKERIFITGAPGLDSILNMEFASKPELCFKLGLDPSEDIIVVIQHPVTTEYIPGNAKKQMSSTLKAIQRLNKQTVIIYPNSDAGGREMISEIMKIESNPKIHVLKNLLSEDYRNLLKHSVLLIGNSSSGIIEAPSFNLPVINIGTRQARRERAGNVVDIEQDSEKIFHLANKILVNEAYRKELQNVTNPYGDGTASKKIVKVLKEIKITPELLQKVITY